MNLNKVYDVYNKYSECNYIDISDISNYHIKTSDEFEKCRGGICWDFVIPISHMLDKYSIPFRCYFTELHVRESVVTHTYVIIDDDQFHYWIECAWQKHKGVNLVFSYKDVERLLKETYNADEIHTVMYIPSKTEGMSSDEFFKYLNKKGIELS